MREEETHVTVNVTRCVFVKSAPIKYSSFQSPKTLIPVFLFALRTDIMKKAKYSRG